MAAAGPDAGALAVGVISAPVRKLQGPEAEIENANRGYLGIGLDDPDDGPGVLVTGVLPDGAAARGGIKKRDIIREVAGTVIDSRAKLLEIMERYRPGDTLAVTVRRGKEDVALKVKLVPKSDINRSDKQNSMGSVLSGRRTGFPRVLQHDTVVSARDCGGPLVDLDGNVLGVNIARAGRVETWALPGDVVTQAVKDIKDRATSVAKVK